MVPQRNIGFSEFQPCCTNTYAHTSEKAIEGIKMNRSFMNVPTGNTKLETIEIVTMKNPILHA